MQRMLKRLAVLLTVVSILGFIAISIVVDDARASPALINTCAVDVMADPATDNHVSVVMPLWVENSSEQRSEPITNNLYLIDTKRVTGAATGNTDTRPHRVTVGMKPAIAGTTAAPPYVMRA
jgi:hypothetical protein